MIESLRVSNQAECWAISDGAAGNERQALALAEQLGLPIRVWRIQPRAPWSWVAPRLSVALPWSLHEPTRSQFVAPWPAIAIGCGRDAALYTRWLRRRSQGRTFAVQILDPRIDPCNYDLVIAPRHDCLHGDNVLRTIGSLNPVEPAWLAQAATAWAELSALPKPRTAVLIGASRGALKIDRAYLAKLLQLLRTRHAEHGGSVLVSTSRRTPPALADWLRGEFAGLPGRYYGGNDDGPNPYAGFLAHASAIVVTPDSVNMLSEACAVGVPVFSLFARTHGSKLDVLHKALLQSGHLRNLDANSDEAAGHPPALRETASVGMEVRRRWQLHLQ